MARVRIQFFCVFSRQRMVSCRRRLSCWVMVTMTSLMTCMRQMPMAVSASMMSKMAPNPRLKRVLTLTLLIGLVNLYRKMKLILERRSQAFVVVAP